MSDLSGSCEDRVTLGTTRVLKRWVARHRQRKQLMLLGEDALDDIGVSRSEAVREAKKHFWEG